MLNTSLSSLDFAARLALFLSLLLNFSSFITNNASTWLSEILLIKLKDIYRIRELKYLLSTYEYKQIYIQC